MIHTFAASFKPTATAVKFDGQGDGGEIVLQFDRSQVAAVLGAWAEFAGKVMAVSIEGTQCRAT